MLGKNSGLTFCRPLKHGQLYLTTDGSTVDAEFDRAKYIKSKTYGHEIDGQLHLTTAGSTIDPSSIKSVDEFNFCNLTQ